MGDISDDLKKFLDCVNGVYKSDEFSTTIMKEVERIKSSEGWRTEYMNLHLHDMDIKYYSRQEGLREDIKKGKQNVNRLNKRLIAEKCFEDLEKSANDPEYQKQLLKEFGIEQ